MTHMCGKLKGIIKQLDEGMMDGIDSVCPPTTGDLWAHEALEGLPGKVIVGGIEPPALKRMSVIETEIYAREVLEKSECLDRLILSTGDATSYDTPVKNLEAITRMVKKYGQL